MQACMCRILRAGVGRSDAFVFCPCSLLTDAVLDTNDTSYYNVSGIMVYDPCIAYGYLQGAMTAVPFVQENSSRSCRPPASFSKDKKHRR